MDFDYELVIDDAGSGTLTCGGDVLWTSDADDDFAEDFPDTLLDIDDEAQGREIIDWLRDEGYIPPGVPVRVIADDSAETGELRALDDDDDDDDEDSDDENL